MHPPVLTKQDFVRRYAAGEFGNASPTWSSLDEWAASRGWTFGRLFHIRNRIAAAKTWYDVSADELKLRWFEALLEYKPDHLYISAMAPTEKTLLQGEVQRGFNGLDLLFTTIAKPMRDALRDWSRSISGVASCLLLDHFLCPKSLEWLIYLLDEYSDHVVEFSTYSVEWGTVQGFNTVFWEVRKY